MNTQYQVQEDGTILQIIPEQIIPATTQPVDIEGIKSQLSMANSDIANLTAQLQERQNFVDTLQPVLDEALEILNN